MTRDETTMILGILKAAYPNFYKDMKTQELTAIIDLWEEMFESEDVNMVKQAVKDLINSSQYPPTIADIKDKLLDLKRVKEDLTEAWNVLLKAIGSGIYNSEEGFESLTPIGKKFIRTPHQLRELAMMDSETINSVVKGQFFKQAEILQIRQDDEAKMLPESKKIREMITGIGQSVDEVLKIGG